MPKPQKPNYANARLVIGVSVGSPDFEGERLTNILKMAKQGMEVYIELGCSLQRHTMAIFYPTKNEQELLNTAIKDGDEWLERNLTTIKEILGDKFKGVGRWENWRAHSEFSSRLEALDELYRTDEKFKEKMDQSIKEFVLRLAQHNIEETDAVRQHIYNYLAEETVIIMQLWIAQGYNFIIYPNKISPILQEGYERFVQSQQLASNMLQWVPVRIKNKSSKSSETKQATLISRAVSTVPTTETLLRDFAGLGILQSGLPSDLTIGSLPANSYEQIVICQLLIQIQSYALVLDPKYRKQFILDLEGALKNNLSSLSGESEALLTSDDDEPKSEPNLLSSLTARFSFSAQQQQEVASAAAAEAESLTVVVH